MANRPTSERKFKNFLLLPNLQVKLSVYIAGLSLALLLALGGIIYFKMGEVMALIIELTDIGDEIQGILWSYIQSVSWWVFLTISAYIGICMFLVISFTHKMIGPTYAFRKHIKNLSEGNYDAKTNLRKTDAFIEIAEDLNSLSDILKEKGSDNHENGKQAS